MFFFFFQAEDGIRDLIVTGVQTCALPIYSKLDPRPPVEEPPPAVETVSPEGRGEKRPRPDREGIRSEEHTSELQSRSDLVCRLLLEKKKNTAQWPSSVRTHFLTRISISFVRL